MTRTYSEKIAADSGEDDDLDDALIEAHTVVAAISIVPDIKDGIWTARRKSSRIGG